jgi:hypothetical protein
MAEFWDPMFYWRGFAVKPMPASKTAPLSTEAPAFFSCKICWKNAGEKKFIFIFYIS